MSIRFLIVLSCFLAFCVNAQSQISRRTNGNTGRVRNSNGLQMNGEAQNNQNYQSDFDREDADYEEEYDNKHTWGRDTAAREEKQIPIGLYQWKLDERLGTIIPAENNDTAVHNFQNYNYTDGLTGEYNYLANIGSPRLSRIFLNRTEPENALFLSPFSYFRDGVKEFRFTNTFSPITNLAYHSAGNSQHGEDRVRAYFATNVNKQAGLGFKIDYAYGRGLYNNAATSLFGGTFYGYYLHDRYNVHAYININHLKQGENGGIEDDIYITNPQSFPQSYDSNNIPTVLSDTWNRNHEQNYYLTHKFNLGFYRDIEVPDSLKPKMPSEDELMDAFNDSVRTVIMGDTARYAVTIDSLKLDWQSKQIPPQEFIPVSSIIHTFDARIMDHSYISRLPKNDYYTNHYYGSWANVLDDTRAMSIRNTFGLALREGFNKWAQMGITAFVTHQLRNYNLPEKQDSTIINKRWTENDISIGAELARTQGKLLHYRATGELWLVGEKAGNFKADADVDLETKLGRFDTLLVNVHGLIDSQLPGFYFRHYHAQSAWWDESLSNQMHQRIEGKVSLKRLGTKVKIGFENITNYTDFAIQNTLKEGKDPQTTKPSDFTHDVRVMQYNGNVQVFSASIAQDFKLGPVHWDNIVTYQVSSNQSVLPLPKVNIYSNLYVLFRIAKVLRVQLGGDLRFFTSYYAPDYSPAIQQFAVQDPNHERIKIGNYPIVNIYANLHLKRCRLYVAASHINQGSGRYFLAPHYPINPMTIRLGLSWNFFN